MNNQPKNGATIDDVLSAVNASFTTMEGRFQKMDERFTAVDKRFDSIESDMTDIKADIHELNTTMVTKDYLDRKVQEFKDESTIRSRKANEKVATVIRTLRDKTIFSDTEAQSILVMEPFPLPK